MERAIRFLLITHNVVKVSGMKLLNLPGKRLILEMNWTLLFSVSLLFGLGIINLYSASSMRLETGIDVAPFYSRQLMWGGVGLVIMFGCTVISYKVVERFSLVFYLFVLFLLILVPLIGIKVYGAQRWLDLGVFNLQPSELAKFAVLLMGARFLSQNGEALNWTRLFKIFLIGFVPFVLIVQQPDLGTALTCLVLVGGMALFHGIQWRVLRVCLTIIPLSLPLAWFGMRDYQKQRVLTFLDPTQDPLGSGYQTIQSQIAIGSGEILGKGFQAGTQSQLRFLPEKHTDYAVAVFCEEWGFVGSVVLIILFCFFLLGVYNTIKEAKDRFGSSLCAGIFFYFFWQIVVNIGMVVGLMPVVGIPLPFISYGGTSMAVNCALIGMVLSVSMYRFVFKTSM